jgi:ubiquinone/menaquinone biosynthesis C-methylase UbiE
LNRVHNLICSSGRWARRVESELIPWGIGQTDLGDDVLEVGPGFGATTKVLARRPGRLSVLELDSGYCERLRRELGELAEITQGDATEMPFADNSFTGAVCFTMLHHIPEPELQDRAFAEIARVLRPGGVFAGTDSVGTGIVFKLIHVGDTLMPIDPDVLPARLAAAGLEDVKVSRSDGTFRFRATKPNGHR